MRRLLIFTVLFVGLSAVVPAQNLTLPNKNGSVKFAVIGDTGTGDRNQLVVAKELAAWRAKFPFESVVMVGDNLYGAESNNSYQKKFEIPYKPLLDAGVKFYAALGNHDEPNQSFYKPFNMNGQRYYTFKPGGASVRFFALDSNYMDDKQIDWMNRELAASGSDWKIMFFHHPLYSSGGTHGSADLLREQIEPVFVKHGVDVVLSGHEHFYERIKPQKGGITYFITGASAKLRRGDLVRTDLTAKGSDQAYSFMLVEIDGEEMHFQVITEKGETLDSGLIRRAPRAPVTTVTTTTKPATVTKPGTTTTTVTTDGAPAGTRTTKTPAPAGR